MISILSLLIFAVVPATPALFESRVAELAPLPPDYQFQEIFDEYLANDLDPKKTALLVSNDFYVPEISASEMPFSFRKRELLKFETPFKDWNDEDLAQEVMKGDFCQIDLKSEFFILKTDGWTKGGVFSVRSVQGEKIHTEKLDFQKWQMSLAKSESFKKFTCYSKDKISLEKIRENLPAGISFYMVLEKNFVLPEDSKIMTYQMEAPVDLMGQKKPWELEPGEKPLFQTFEKPDETVDLWIFGTFKWKRKPIQTPGLYPYP
ncbi:MAG: hypothetical protein J0L93_11430 [Deltaproteobacteria bacterium]|nr:hypothetical protein [Deltaproteobacteria bacterium]